MLQLTSSGIPVGSSPLARGLRRGPADRPGEGGIIPARAGFTLSAPDAPEVEPGSSPLARGLRHLGFAASDGPWIIPARAGFTRTGCPRSCPPADHPRSRGVYFLLVLNWMSTPGSSPLARGLPMSPSYTPRVPGIIPARAGFTPRCPQNARQCGDHPRSRGVYGRSRPTSWSLRGSSPLARGLRSIFGSFRSGFGIIPARAGFTLPH